MGKLIGAAKEEDEDEFWAEHADYFQSSEEDEEFDDEDSDIGEDEREDSEDSDIDADEDEEDSDAEAAEAEKEVKRAARSGGRKGIYQDPALRRSRAASTMPRKKRAVEIDPSETIAARKEKRQATDAADERRKEMKAAEAKKKKPVRKPVVAERKLTAQEMFAEAARTEVINKASLERLLELEEEKRKETIRKRVIVGPRVKFLSRTIAHDPNVATSRRTKNLITFTDVSKLKVAEERPLGTRLIRLARSHPVSNVLSLARARELSLSSLTSALLLNAQLRDCAPRSEWLRYSSATDDVRHHQTACEVRGPADQPSLC